MRRVLAGVVLGTLSVSLAACGGSTPAVERSTTTAAAGPSAPSAPGAVTSSSPDAGTPASPLPATAPASPTAPAASLGSPVEVGYGVTVTVHTVDRAVPELAGSPGPRTAVDIEACASTQDVTVAGSRWSLLGAAGGPYPAVVPTQAPQPAYPYEAEPLVAGECRRGWLLFALPQDAAVTTARYELADGGVFQWAF
jgi:hypothetical protein